MSNEAVAVKAEIIPPEKNSSSTGINISQQGDESKSNSQMQPNKNDIIPFDFSKKLKEPRRDKYSSEELLDPKSQSDKDKYFEVYKDYITKNLTQKQLAEEYGCSHFHVCRMIKWVTFQLGDPDPDVQLRSTIDTLQLKKQEIQKELDAATDPNIKVKLWKQFLSFEKTLAQLKGIMSGALIDMSDKRQVTVQMNPEFKRRTGSDLEGGEKKDERGNVHEEDISDDNVSDSVSHRTGTE